MTSGTVSFENANANAIVNAAANANAVGVAVENARESEGTGFSETLKNAAGSVAASGGKYDLDAIFEAASQKYGVPVSLLKAVAKAESSFRPDVTSKCGAMGIMQLMPATAKSLGVTDPFDPEQNIMGGADLLRQFLDKYNGDVKLSLAAYNAGPGNVAKYGGIPPFNETQNYVKNVISYMGEGAITAGTVPYKASSGTTAYLSSQKSEYAPSSSSSKTSFGDTMAQMMLMKIIEMQMNSSDDDKKNKVF